MTNFRLDSRSTYLTLDDVFSSVPDQLPTAFESVPNNQTYHSYNSTSLAPRHPAVMASHKLPECFTASFPSFEPVFNSAAADLYSSSCFSETSINRLHPSAHPRSTTAMQQSLASHSTPPLAEMYFDSLFSAHPNAPPVPVTGTPIALQKLGVAVQNSLAIGPTDSITAAAAFEASLLPSQAASILPTSAQMISLFSLPRPLQRASGLDVMHDVSISEDYSARYTCTLPLLAYKEIDCARQYLEICSRHQDMGSIVEIGMVTLHGNQCILELLPIVSRQPATHTLFIFRQLTASFFNNYTETYRPFVSTHGLPTMHIEPPPGQMRAVRLSPEMTSALAKSVRMGLTDHGEEVNRLILAGRVDFMPPSCISGTRYDSRFEAVRVGKDLGVVDANIEGLRILRAAQKYTNTELHGQIRASGSDVSYNSVTKRITNALKAQAKQSLKSGEDLNEEYETLRQTFNRTRVVYLKALDGISKKRGSGSDDESISNKRHKTLIIGDKSEEEEEAVESEEDADDQAVNNESDQGASGLRRSARVRRSPTSRATEEDNFADDEDDPDKQESVTESEDSDVSEYDEDD